MIEKWHLRYKPRLYDGDPSHSVDVLYGDWQLASVIVDRHNQSCINLFLDPNLSRARMAPGFRKQLIAFATGHAGPPKGIPWPIKT